jgi:microsomal epoxide hydrolase
MTMTDTAFRPFSAGFDDEVVADLHERLRHARWPEQLDDAAAWSMGCDLPTLQALCEAWRDFDVPGFAARLNAWPQFVTTIDGQQVHFVHLRSPCSNALPLLLLHGWPGSIWEFHRVAPALAQPSGNAQPAFHVVCPSLPGYGFSGPTRVRGWHVARVAAALAELMRRLGHARYGVQGGDWGAIIATHLAAHDPERCVGIHLNMVVAPPPDPSRPLHGLTDDEAAEVEALRRWAKDDFAYQHLHATRPLSLACALTDSPMGLAAWMLEKFHAWADLEPTDGDVLARLGADTLCANLSLHWLTGTVHSALRLYFESSGPDRSVPLPRVRVPTACAIFPKDIYRPPRAWADAQYPRIERWTRFARGGHFAALEEPEALVQDVRAFFASLGGSRAIAAA